MPVHVSSTTVLNIRRSKFYYTVPGIVTPIGGRPVHRLREDPAKHQNILSEMHGHTNIKFKQLSLHNIT